MGMGKVMAGDVLTVSDVSLPQGVETIVDIFCSFDTQFKGYQLDVELDEGLSLVMNSNGQYGENGFSGTDHSISSSNPSTGKYRFVVTSNSGQLLPNSGTLLKFKVTGTGDEAIGTTFHGTVTASEFTTAENAAQNLSEVLFSITIEENDGRIHFDENSTELPIYTAGEKGNVTMTRTIKADEWSTIVLPFTLTKNKAEVAFGSDVQLAEFSGFEVDYGDDEENVIPLGIKINLTTYTMSARKGMTGGKPFFIKTSKVINSFEADDVTLVAAVSDVEKTDEYDTPGKLTGTLVKSVIPADGLFINDNKFWYSTGKTNVKAFRCWLELGAVLGKDTDFGARVTLHFDDSDATGIENVNDNLNDNRYYDLQGRRVAHSVKKGLYIRNGKKEIVK